MSVEEIEKLMQLMKQYVVDQVQVGEVTITKTQHPSDEAATAQEPAVDDDELLFYSSKG